MDILSKTSQRKLCISFFINCHLISWSSGSISTQCYLNHYINASSVLCFWKETKSETCDAFNTNSYMFSVFVFMEIFGLKLVVQIQFSLTISQPVWTFLCKTKGIISVKSGSV